MKGNCHVLTNGIFINHLNILTMKKKSKITSSLKEKEIVNKVLNDSNGEQLDLYKAIFGGKLSASCPVVAVSAKSARASAYDRDTFLQAAPAPHTPIATNASEASAE